MDMGRANYEIRESREKRDDKIVFRDERCKQCNLAG